MCIPTLISMPLDPLVLPVGYTLHCSASANGVKLLKLVLLGPLDIVLREISNVTVIVFSSMNVFPAYLFDVGKFPKFAKPFQWEFRSSEKGKKT